MKYLCMFVAFKIKTNKSEKGEIRKNLTIMKTGKTELPRSTSGADEFFILLNWRQNTGTGHWMHLNFIRVTVIFRVFIFKRWKVKPVKKIRVFISSILDPTTD